MKNNILFPLEKKQRGIIEGLIEDNQEIVLKATREVIFNLNLTGTSSVKGVNNKALNPKARELNF